MLAAHAVIDNHCQYHGRRCWLGTVRQGPCDSAPLAGFVYESTIFLDMAHTFEVLQLLNNLDREEGHTVLVVPARRQQRGALLAPYSRALRRPGLHRRPAGRDCNGRGVPRGFLSRGRDLARSALGSSPVYLLQ